MTVSEKVKREMLELGTHPHVLGIPDPGTAVNINPDRVRNMLKAERRRRGKDSNYYGSHTPAYHVARRFKITCAYVRELTKKNEQP